jgi:hypothetical protein
MKLTVQLKLLSKTFFFKLQSIDIPSIRTWGKSSRIPNTSKHVLFFDYDNIDEDTLVNELYALIEEFHVGNIYVFELDRPLAYHCVCTDYFTANEVKKITMASSCDIGFVIAPRYDKFRNWVLRDYIKGQRERPTYAFMISSPYHGERLQSVAHANFLTTYYGFEMVLNNPDGNTEKIRLESYLTASRTEKEDKR